MKYFLEFIILLCFAVGALFIFNLSGDTLPIISLKSWLIIAFIMLWPAIAGMLITCWIVESLRRSKYLWSDDDYPFNKHED